VETILVAGADSLVGANLAASLSSRQPVIGVAFRDAVRIAGCETELCRSTALDAIQAVVRRVSPQRVVYCGAGAQSCWDAAEIVDDTAVARAAAWQEAAAACGAQWTLISSDGIFTGPWMFHAENSQSWCASAAATALRQIEEQTASRHPEALIVRTHAFGWSPTCDGREGWLERLLAGFEEGAGCLLDGVRHASPILATDLVEVIQKAWQSGLAGVYHIAGAERVNPVQFARQVSHEFGLPFLHAGAPETLTDRATGFGRGETSLQTRKVRRALGIGLPMLSEGLQRLHQQQRDGFRNRLGSHMPQPHARVA
jgi:dTDP-4-dehydrorhamnose reductase